MNSLNKLKKLESELRETKDYLGEQEGALNLTKEYFKSYIGKGQPPAEKMNEDYLKLCYEQVQNSILYDRDQALKNIGIGIAIAEKINSLKFKLDFLSKAQYVLYEIFEFPHVAMSLGNYIVLNTEDYDNRKAWTHFHNGNIWLDLEEFNNAKEEYEQAKELAIKMSNKNAEMTIYERLGLVSRKLKEWNLAEDYYKRSEEIENNGNTQDSDSIKNKVRRLIGLGLVYYDRALDETNNNKKEKLCQNSEIYFKEALQIANWVNYPANKAAAYSSLGDLYRECYSKLFHRMAYDINTNILELSPQLKRVKHDADRMN
ncbi:MAG: hypothetical protein ACE5JB_08660 [bacterium]